jgi:hypothetical protein
MTGKGALPGGALAGFSIEELAASVDGVEAIVVFHLADSAILAAYVRPGSGYTAGAVAVSLREVYKTSQVHARRLDFLSPIALAPRDDGDLSDPLVTLELPGRVIVLRRVASHVVATFFDSTVPLGFIRLHAARIVGKVREGLPSDAVTPPSGTPAVSQIPPTVQVVSHVPVQTSIGDEADLEEPARTLAFPSGGAVVVRSSRPPPRGTRAEIDRATKLLSYLDAHAPDPHVVRLRVSLRAGIKPLALDHPDSLGADAMVLLETAAEDILGIDRAELRSKL